MIVVVGEILVDRFPDYERIGGAPFNFAFHLKQMGWPVRFLTRIGADTDGRRILDRLQSSGFQRDDIQIDDRHATGIVDVCLDLQGVPRFAIRTEAAYDYLDLSLSQVLNSSAVKLIYFGSLAQRTGHGYLQIQRFLESASPAARKFCDINLRAPHIHAEAIQSCLHHADILKLNRDELLHISRLCRGPEDEAEAPAWLMRRYDIGQVVLTRGERGSAIFTAEYTMDCPPAPRDTIADTVGAGDAYAAVFAAGLLKGLGMRLTLELASDFSAHVCTLPGALPEDDTPYKRLRQNLQP